MEPEQIEVPGSEGLRLVAHQWRSQGSPVVFLHGFAHHGRAWDAVITQLPETTRPIALDLRGHGDSDRAAAASGYNISCHAADLNEALKSLQIEEAALVGHSMGASVALRHAASPGAKTSCIALVDCGPPESSAGTRKAIRDTKNSPQRVANVAEYLRAIASSYPLAEPRLLHSFARSSLRATSDGLFEEKFDARLKESRPAGAAGSHLERFYRDLEQVRVPAMIARGIGSAILSRNVARTMVDRHLLDGTLAEIRGAGHAVPLDNPAALAIAIDGFLRDHSKTPKPRR
jgi:pimeloyl-ACP methyl ester carboxylesterase